MKPRRVLLYCPMPESGFAEHSHYQASGLARMGVDVQLLTCRGFLPDHRDKPYTVLPWLFAPYRTFRLRWIKALWFAFVTVANELLFAARILFWGHRHVLIAGTSDTLALLWVWPHLLLRWLGVRYAANIHDPKRKRTAGRLFHAWQVRASFLPISVGLIHEDFEADQPDIPRHVRCLRVPYGCYESDIGPGDGTALRAELAPQGSGRRIFLAFGYIADRKNLDLCIRAVAQVPRAVLIAAGRVASRHDRPGDYYRELARELGCADRVRIDEGFVADDQIRHYFGAADAILLAYKSEFVSQSGVLLLASNWSKPVVASSGPGPLTATVTQFDLGIAVPPDDVAALRGAIEQLIERGYSSGGWPAFREHASWQRNVGPLIEEWNREREYGSQ